MLASRVRMASLQTGQNGWPTSRILQLNTGRYTPQWKWWAPTNAPTVSSDTGLVFSGHLVQSALLVVGSATPGVSRWRHFSVALLKFVVTLGSSGSGPV